MRRETKEDFDWKMNQWNFDWDNVRLADRIYGSVGLADRIYQETNIICIGSLCLLMDLKCTRFGFLSIVGHEYLSLVIEG